jgi:hypothetical protein
MPFETCRHVKEDGIYCGSPALRGRKYCYSHLMQRGRRLRRALAQSRNEPCQLIIPPLEDLGSIRVALSEVVQALAAGQIDQRSAGLMLYAIQQATTVSLRMIQVEAQIAATPADTEQETVTDHGIQEYPEFERKFGIQSAIDLEAETDHAMRGAEEQATVLAIAPTSQPGADRPVPVKSQYTREESYQLFQWQIHRMTKQIREYEEERRQEQRKKAVASATPQLAEPLSSSA